MNFAEIMDKINEMGGSKWLVAQVLSFIGYSLMVVTGYIKKEKKMLRVQDLQLVFMAGMTLLLNAYSGAIINTLAIVKNEIYLAGKLNKYTKAAVVGFGAVMTFIFNNSGIMGWWPILSLFVFTYLLGKGGAIGIKLLILGTTIGWGIFDLYITNYVGVVFDVLTVISCIIGIIRLRKENN